MGRSSRKRNADTPREKRRPFEVLIVDDEPEVRAAVGCALAGERRVVVHEAGTLAEARRNIEEKPIDLVLLDVRLPDGSGLDLAAELADRRSGIQSIVMTGEPNMGSAVAGIRAGVSDFLCKPLTLAQLNGSVERAIDRRCFDQQRERRVARMKSLCKKLNQARHEVTQQVDILCNDLVTAYQELVDQMRQLELTSEFKAIVNGELDLEQLLRKVLEFLLQRVGPTNAVIFLPSQSGGYTVGGYINYNCDRDTVDLVLDHMADICAGRIAETTELVHLTTDEAVEEWLEHRECGWLMGKHVVGVPCIEEDEVLAVMMLFRDAEEPFTSAATEMMLPMARMFAGHLVKVISVHHRHNDLFGDDSDNPYDEDDDDGGLLA